MIELSKDVAALLESVESALADEKLLTTERLRQEEQEFLRNLQPGQRMPDGTVYLGKYAPKDRQGNSLGNIFNVFAAPEDLTGASGNRKIFTYVEAVRRIAALKSWHGHDGTHYATDKEFYKAVKDGSYDGGWIVPPRELLTGSAADEPSRDRQGEIVQPDNLFDRRNCGSFKNTFATPASNGLGFSHGYWSSSERRDTSSYMWAANFLAGLDCACHKNGERQSCRPVRLVPVPGGGAA